MEQRYDGLELENIPNPHSVLIVQGYIPLSAQLYFIERILGVFLSLLIVILSAVVASVILPFVLLTVLWVPSLFFAMTLSAEAQGLEAQILAVNGFLLGLLLMPLWLAAAAALTAITALIAIVFIPKAIITLFDYLYEGYQTGARAVLNDLIVFADVCVKNGIYRFKREAGYSSDAILESRLAILNANWYNVATSSVQTIIKLEYKAFLEHIAIMQLVKSIVSPAPENRFPDDRLITIRYVKEAQKFYALMQTELVKKFYATADRHVHQEIETIYDLYCQKMILMHKILTLLRQYKPLPTADNAIWEELTTEVMSVRELPDYCVALSEHSSLFLQNTHRKICDSLDAMNGDSIEIALEDLSAFRNLQRAIQPIYDNFSAEPPPPNIMTQAVFEQTFLLPESELNNFRHTRYTAAEIAAYKKLRVNEAKGRQIDALLRRYHAADARLLSNDCAVVTLCEISDPNQKYILSKRYKKNDHFLPYPETAVANTVVQKGNLISWCCGSPTRQGRVTHPVSRDPLLESDCEKYKEGNVEYLTQYKLHPYYQYPEQQDRKDEIYSEELTYIERELNKICPRSTLDRLPVAVSTSVKKNQNSVTTREQMPEEICRKISARIIAFEKLGFYQTGHENLNKRCEFDESATPSMS